MKNPILNELDDNALDTVSGGTEPFQNEEIMPIDPCDVAMKLHI